MTKHIALLIGLSCLSLSHATERAEISATKCIGWLKHPWILPELREQNAWFYRARFEELEKGDRRSTHSEKVISTPDLDVELILLGDEEFNSTRRHRDRLWQSLWRRAPRFVRMSRRVVKLTVKSESALRKFTDYIVLREDGGLLAPLINLLTIVKSDRLIATIEGWPAAKSVEFTRSIYRATWRDRLKRMWAAFRKKRNEPMDFNVTLTDGNILFDVKDALTFRSFVRNLSPISNAAYRSDLRARLDWISANFGVNLKVFESHFDDVTRSLVAQLSDLLNLQFEPFTREVSVGADERFRKEPDKFAFAERALSALKLLQHREYTYVNPRRSECWRQSRPCGWLSRATFDANWPTSLPDSDDLRYDTARRDHVIAPKRLIEAIDLAESLGPPP